ncbi:hypothetical protein KO465_04805 [Candidatus Micrarchaeota archaeon]|jgi:hypothetical protein|nr:hypothetical protein [Candidatus Micrarchaeota archaeon]
MIVFAETIFGSCLRFGESIEQIRKLLIVEVGSDKRITEFREATEDDIKDFVSVINYMQLDVRNTYKQKHLMLHKAVSEAVHEFIKEKENSFDKATLQEFFEWSYLQTIGDTPATKELPDGLYFDITTRESYRKRVNGVWFRGASDPGTAKCITTEVKSFNDAVACAKNLELIERFEEDEND